MDTILKQSKKSRLYKAQTRSIGQEKEIAGRVSGRVVRGSGCGKEKADVRKRGVVRIECKTTQRKSFSVTMDMIDKIEEIAASSGEVPVIVVEFIDGNGNPLKEVCVVPSIYLQEFR